MELATIWTPVFILVLWTYLCHGQDCKTQPPGDDAWIETSRVPYQCQGECTRLTGVFCTSDAVIVQLWTGSDVTWSLVWQKEWRPTGTGQRKFLDLEPDEYLTITPRYRLGVSAMPGQNGGDISVRKLFSETLIQLLSCQQPGPYQLGSNYQFDDIHHPGTFLVDVCDASVCPEFVIPSDPQTPPPEMCKLVTSEEGRIQLEKERILGVGLMKAIRTYFCAQNDVRVQIWEPESADSDDYRLLWEKTLRPITTGGQEVIISLPPGEYIYMRDTYRLALQPIGPSGAISVPYRFSSANLVSSRGSSAVRCGLQEFQGLLYPSEFLLTFCYDSECTGTSGDPAGIPVTPCSEQVNMTTSSTTDGATTPDTDANVGMTDSPVQAIGRASSLICNTVTISCKLIVFTLIIVWL